MATKAIDGARLADARDQHEDRPDDATLTIITSKSGRSTATRHASYRRNQEHA
ncbi:hypothetical protein [Burkholderia sp. 8Y]|uniref:hypothetical protein n=1 Tax=Burkholderia sp. 8Y TaxID=2653133 RepID=UPI00135CBE8B|nr:hypothetical protein [Burkholderia sp. 8Y]